MDIKHNKTDKPNKILMEMTLYIFVCLDGGVVVGSFLNYFGISMRTLYRYAKDLHDSGILGKEKLHYLNSGAIEFSRKIIEHEIPDISDVITDPMDSHLVRLNRLGKIWKLYCYNVFIPTINNIRYGAYLDDYEEDGELITSYMVMESLLEQWPDMKLSNRMIQRDLKLLTKACKHYVGEQ